MNRFNNNNVEPEYDPYTGLYKVSQQKKGRSTFFGANSTIDAAAVSSSSSAATTSSAASKEQGKSITIVDKKTGETKVIVFGDNSTIYRAKKQ